MISFNVPIDFRGDSYSRFLLRVAEMRQSILIISQCINRLPVGSTHLESFKSFLPERGLLKQDMHALIHHFKFFSEGFILKPEDCFASVDSKRRIWCFFG